MPLINMKEIETLAADLVVAELRALRWELRDTGKLGTGIRDYDVVFKDGHTEPLEVTSSADRDVVNTMDRMQGNNWIDADIRRVWGLMVPYTSTGSDGGKGPFDRRACIELVVPFVEQLERDGLEEFDTAMVAYVPGHPYQEWARGLLALGVRSGSSYPPSAADDKPGIWLWTGGGGAYGPDTVSAAVEKVAADEGNQAKLAACSDAPRRHLFVMVTSASEDLAFHALLTVLDKDVAAPRVPVLPEAITTVWASVMERGIYVTPPGEWKTFGAPRP